MTRVRVHRAEQPVRAVRRVEGEIVEGPAVWPHDKVPTGWEIVAAAPTATAPQDEESQENEEH